ncbi:tetratricopeptide repeat-containing sensor histidine kinase [uncultured Aquimarina sp.]|uniref:tetratricopeptide repeat-containing sensor histidine kinase n=1 Tax=uncultured Aquimarina sp. TaxID=575652 RepID=UPI00261E6F02|nr:tetratricopeptide repeat-containing sensor histidine kinase [uncultured Aquimarina sp.]
MVFNIKKTTGILILFICFLHCSCDKEETVALESIDPIDHFIEQAEDNSKTKEERKKHLDSAYTIYITLEDNIYKREKIHEISVAYYRLKEFKVSEILDKEMLSLSQRIGDSLGIAESYFNLGVYCRKKLILDSAYYYFYKADKMYKSFDVQGGFKSIDYFYNHGKVLIDLAQISRKINDYNQSEELTIQAIEKFKVSGNLKYIPLCYTNLGIASRELGRYEEAIEYYRRASEYAENQKRDDTLYKIIYFNNVGFLYMKKGNFHKAEEFYNREFEFIKYLNKDPKRLARFLDNLGYAKFKNNRHNDNTFYLLNRAMKIRDSIGDINGLCESYLNLSEYYQSKKNKGLAKKFARKSEKTALKHGDNNDLLDAYRLLAQVSSPEEGRRYAMKYINLNDSLAERDNQYKNQFARIRYESDTLQKENEQKSKEIQQVQEQNTIYLLGILLLCTLIGFVIYFAIQRNKYLKQQSKMIQFQTAYETETRIAKRLHDELGNDIFQVMTQYQNTPNYNPQLLEKLNKSYTKARDISRENSDFEIDETFEEELRNMLQNYTNKNMLLVQKGVDTIPWEHTDSTIKIAIYRVLQELMTNMQKHSQADRIVVIFSKKNKNIQINYTDNGIGIDTTQLISKNGLRNIQKRIEAIGGAITFDTQKHKGFKARIMIPV